MSQHIAFVTGAMGGLGTAFCQAFDKAGYKVVAAYHPEFDDKEAWLAEQKAEGFTNFIPVACDVGNYESCVAAAAEAEKLAGGVIDVLVNNAGITRDKFFTKMDKGQWDAVINTNLNSVYNVTQPFAAKMAEKGWGRVINISSVNGVKGQAGQTNYSAAKAGVVGMTKAAAKELAHLGVRVNAIAPGLIRTAMTESMPQHVWDAKLSEVPMGRAGDPAEVAAVALFLASDLSSYMTGAVLEVTGGRHL